VIWLGLTAVIALGLAEALLAASWWALKRAVALVHEEHPCA
jgi:hypothetical protein